MWPAIADEVDEQSASTPPRRSASSRWRAGSCRDQHHRRPRDGAVGLIIVSTPRTDGARGEQPGDRGLDAPVASRTTIGGESQRPLRAGPSGTACRRTSVGGSTTSIGSSRCGRARPTCPAAAACRRPPGACPPRVPRPALDGEHHEVAALGDHPREDHPRRSDPSAAGSRPRPPRRRAQQRLRVVSRPYCAASVRAWSLKSGGIDSRVRFGSSRSPKQHDDRDRADHERDADERELEEPDGSRRRRRLRRRRRSR